VLTRHLGRQTDRRTDRVICYTPYKTLFAGGITNRAYYQYDNYEVNK